MNSNELLVMFLTLPQTEIQIKVSEYLKCEIKKITGYDATLYLFWEEKKILIRRGWLRLKDIDDNVSVFNITDSCLCRIAYITQYNFVVLLINKLIKDLNELNMFIEGNRICKSIEYGWKFN